MTTELNFPPIDAKAIDAPVALAEPAAAPVQAAKIDLQAVALASFETAHAEAKKAQETLAGVVHDLSTSTKLADAKSLRQRLINAPLADARKVSAALKAKLTAVSKAVGAELTTIEAAFAAADKLITPQIEARELVLAEERRAAAEKEAARIKVHADNLAKLAQYAEHARGLPSERIKAGIALVEGIQIDRAAWEEFADRAEEQKGVTLDRMRAELAQAVQLEAEAARLAQERAELERQRAELEAQRAELEAQQLMQEAAAQQSAAAACVGAADQAKAEATVAIAAAQAKAPPPPVAPVTAATQAAAEPAPAPGTIVRLLKLSEVQATMGLPLGAADLSGLGFEPELRGAAKLYREDVLPAICQALIRHVIKVEQSLTATA